MDMMTQLHEAMAKELLARVESGEASPADLKVVHDFLKTNGISCETKDSEALSQLKENTIEIDDTYAHGLRVVGS